MVWQLLAPAAGAIIGSLVGKKSTKDVQESQEEQQREFAQKGIQWRVADAKAAGVHPLYAMGAQLPSFNPVSVMDNTAGYAQVGMEMGQRVADYLKKPTPQVEAPREYAWATKKINDKGEVYEDVEMLSREDYLKRMEVKGVELGYENAVREGRRMEADIDESKARRLEIEARANKERMSLLADPLLSDAVEYSPDQVVSPRAAEPWVRAGRHAGWTEFDLDNGFRAVFPSASSLSESLEALESSTVLKAAIIGYNVKRYGPGWLKQAARMFPGVFGGGNAAPPSDVPVY